MYCNHRFVNLPEYSKMDEKVISYCGLWCNDCIPSRKDFFSLADSFDEMLKDLQFEHYANLKSEVTKEFGDYPAFLSVLHRIREPPLPGPMSSRWREARLHHPAMRERQGFYRLLALPDTPGMRTS